jgi:4,5-dihydroxyphthalate decarboxylase
MQDSLKLTLALDRYDRHFPFFDHTVSVPNGVDLDVKQVGESVTLRDGSDRHGKMIKDQAYDICEFSMSTFLMAKAQDVPIAGIPVFPRRLFSQSQMWVHPDSDIWHPRDLVGKKVALRSFQTTLSLLAKGDLKFYYNVPWEDIHWILTASEKLKFEVKDGVKIDFIGNSQNTGHMLESGEIDALFMPHPPASVMRGETRARRLFADCQAEEARYLQQYGDFPIMHLVAIREDLVEQEPWLAGAILQMFEESFEIAKSYYEDPNWSRMLWGRHYFELERDKFEIDPWQNGFQRNRANIERFIKYSHDQGLIDAPYPADTLFASKTLDT